MFFEQLSYPTHIRSFLYLGSVDTLDNSSFMNTVDSVISVMNYLSKRAFPTQHMVIPIEDSKNHNLTPYFMQVIEWIEKARQDQKVVLIHCEMGMSRSASFVLAWLMYEKHLDHQQVDLATELTWLKSQRTMVSPNDHFLSELKTLEEDLNQKLFHTRLTKLA
jgi:predicted protein tyrosine phosphatase